MSVFEFVELAISAFGPLLGAATIGLWVNSVCFADVERGGWPQ
jgi:hypothetical protein